MNSERRGLVVVVAVLLVSAVLGGIYGPNVRATTASADDYQTAVRDFTRVLNVVQNNYADTVDVDKAVYQGAIPGICACLIPIRVSSMPSSFLCCGKTSRESTTAWG